MIDLHLWPTPNAQKVSVFLEEAGLPYRVVPVDITKGDQFTPEFLAISPNNRMPAIVDHAPAGGGEPISVFESGAILLYLAEKTGQFLPADVRGRTAVLEWLFWQMAGVGPMFGQAGHFLIYAPESVPYAKERYQREVGRLAGVLEKRLEGREHVAGDYSIADMALLPWMRAMQHYGHDRAAFPRVAAWIERLEARPATARGLAVGKELRRKGPLDEAARTVLFGQGKPAS